LFSGKVVNAIWNVANRLDMSLRKLTTVNCFCFEL
jgi:hypothetical protein